jgi:release factor glutamine methyltransferase
MPELAVPLRSLLDEAAGELCRAGVPESRRQATRLWVELTGTMDHRSDHAVELDRAEAFRQAARRLSAGEPFSHVTGWAGFRHLTLRSDRRALIPRPETEGLVELLLQRVRQGIVADVGTGTGCIALSLALEGSFSRVVAVDASTDALALARTNTHLAGAAGTVDLVRGDLCAPLRGAVFDALISNPPYLTEREYAALDPSVRDWEPVLSLQSGPDGLEATSRLIRQGLEVVGSGGWFAIEVDCSRAGTAAQLAVEQGWSEVSLHMDLFGRERYLLARRSDTR